jgi:hypothetical protein
MLLSFALEILGRLPPRNGGRRGDWGLRWRLNRRLSNRFSIPALVSEGRFLKKTMVIFIRKKMDSLCGVNHSIYIYR